LPGYPEETTKEKEKIRGERPDKKPPSQKRKKKGQGTSQKAKKKKKKKKLHPAQTKRDYRNQRGGETQGKTESPLQGNSQPLLSKGGIGGPGERGHLEKGGPHQETLYGERQKKARIQYVLKERKLSQQGGGFSEKMGGKIMRNQKDGGGGPAFLLETNFRGKKIQKGKRNELLKAESVQEKVRTSRPWGKKRREGKVSGLGEKRRPSKRLFQNREGGKKRVCLTGKKGRGFQEYSDEEKPESP